METKINPLDVICEHCGKRYGLHSISVLHGKLIGERCPAPMKSSSILNQSKKAFGKTTFKAKSEIR